MGIPEGLLPSKSKAGEEKKKQKTIAVAALKRYIPRLAEYSEKEIESAMKDVLLGGDPERIKRFEQEVRQYVPKYQGPMFNPVNDFRPLFRDVEINEQDIVDQYGTNRQEQAFTGALNIGGMLPVAEEISRASQGIPARKIAAQPVVKPTVAPTVTPTSQSPLPTKTQLKEGVKPTIQITPDQQAKRISWDSARYLRGAADIEEARSDPKALSGLGRQVNNALERKQREEQRRQEEARKRATGLQALQAAQEREKLAQQQKNNQFITSLSEESEIPVPQLFQMSPEQIETQRQTVQRRKAYERATELKQIKDHAQGKMTELDTRIQYLQQGMKRGGLAWGGTTPENTQSQLNYFDRVERQKQVDALKQVQRIYNDILQTSEQGDSLADDVLRSFNANMNPEQIPFAGSLMKLDSAERLYKTAKKFRELELQFRQQAWNTPGFDASKDGPKVQQQASEMALNSLSQSERDLFEAVGLQATAQGLAPEGVNIGRTASDIIFQMLPYMAEFALTQGAVAPIRQAGTNLSTKLLGDAATRGVMGKIGAGAIQAAATGLAGTAQALMNPAEIASDTYTRMTDKYTAEFNPEMKRVEKMVFKEKGDSFEKAIGKAIAVRALEMTSEYTGEAFQAGGKVAKEYGKRFSSYMAGKLGPRWGEKLKPVILSKWLSRIGASGADDIFMRMKNATGWQGVWPEFLEEMVVIAPQNIVEGRPTFEGYSPENMAATLLGIAGFGGVARGAGSLVRGGVNAAQRLRGQPIAREEHPVYREVLKTQTAPEAVSEAAPEAQPIATPEAPVSPVMPEVMPEAQSIALPQEGAVDYGRKYSVDLTQPQIQPQIQTQGGPDAQLPAQGVNQETPQDPGRETLRPADRADAAPSPVQSQAEVPEEKREDREDVGTALRGRGYTPDEIRQVRTEEAPLLLSDTPPLLYFPQTDRYSGQKLQRGDVLTDDEGRTLVVDRANGYNINVDEVSPDGQVIDSYTISADTTSEGYYPSYRTGKTINDILPSEDDFDMQSAQTLEPAAPQVEAQPIPEQTPQIEPQTSQAEIPLVITKDTKQKLVDKGFTSKEINQMTPQEAQDNLTRMNPRYKQSGAVEGRTVPQTLPNGEKAKGKYVLVSADDVLASHNESNFSKTKGFPTTETGETPNDRNYETDKIAQAEVQRIAKSLDARMIDNVPRVSKDGIVLDGNNRTMSRKLASRLGTDTEYKEALKERADMYGYTPEDVDKIKNPMLVYELEGDVKYDTQTFAKFNKSTIKEKSPVDKAIELSRTVDQRTKSILADLVSKEEFEKMSDFYSSKEDVKTARNHLVQSGIVGENELNRYFDPTTGGFTNEGKALMESVLLGSVVSEESLRRLDSEGVRDMRGRLIRNIKRLAGMSQYDSRFGIGPYLDEAIALQSEAVSRKLDVKDLLKQTDAFEDKPVKAGTILLHDALSKSDRKLGQILDAYSNSVGAEATGQGGMFGGPQDADQAFKELYVALVDLEKSSGQKEPAPAESNVRDVQPTGEEGASSKTEKRGAGQQKKTTSTASQSAEELKPKAELKGKPKGKAEAEPKKRGRPRKNVRDAEALPKSTSELDALLKDLIDEEIGEEVFDNRFSNETVDMFPDLAARKVKTPLEEYEASHPGEYADMLERQRREDAMAERERVQKELEKLIPQLRQLESELDSPLASLAPDLPEKVRNMRRKVAAYKWKIAQQDQLLNFGEAEQASLFFRSFHGGARGIERFDPKRFSTGSYGWGVYTSDLKNVSEEYAGREYDYTGTDLSADEWGRVSIVLMRKGGVSAAQAIRDGIRRIEGMISARNDNGYVFPPIARQRLKDEIGILKRINPKDLKAKGQVYEVDVDLDPKDMLRWDAPISKQSEAVRAKILPVLEERGLTLTTRNAGGDAAKKVRTPITESSTGGEFYTALWDQLWETGEYSTPGRAGRNSQREASELLLSLGIPGIVYEVQETEKDGNNYVIFDPKYAQITDSFYDNRDTRNLVAVHNTDARKLQNMLKLGGIPVPSIAIIRSDVSDFKNFGDVSLIGTADLVTPSKDSKVYNADIYSPRYPSISLKFSDADIKKMRKILEPHAEGSEWYGFAYELGSGKSWDEIGFDILPKKAFLAEINAQDEITGETKFEKDMSVREAIDKRRDEYEAWWRDFSDREGLTPKEVYYAGYTNAGKRKYKDHTLSNVVAELKKSLVNGENHMGLGPVRASTSRKFTNLSQIRNASGSIVPGEEMTKVKEDIDQKFKELFDTYYPQRESKSQGFGQLDAFADDLMALSQGDMKHVREMYPGVDLSGMREFMQMLRDAPTEYFEAKVRRAVDLSEFRAAVVPKGFNPAIRKALENKGVLVYEYDKEVEGDRKRVVSEAASETNALFHKASTSVPIITPEAFDFVTSRVNPEFKERINVVEGMRVRGVYHPSQDEINIARTSEEEITESTLHELGHRFFLRYAPSELHYQIISATDQMEQVIGKEKADDIKSRYSPREQGFEFERAIFEEVAQDRAKAFQKATKIAGWLKRVSPKGFADWTVKTLANMIHGAHVLAESVKAGQKGKWKKEIHSFLTGKNYQTKHGAFRTNPVQRVSQQLQDALLERGMRLWEEGKRDLKSWNEFFGQMNPAVLPMIPGLYKSVKNTMEPQLEIDLPGDVKQQLISLGYTEEEISKMKKERAERVANSGLEKPLSIYEAQKRIESAKRTTKVTPVAPVDSVNPTVKERKKAAKGIGRESVLAKLKRGIRDAKNASTRHFRHLDPRRFGMEADILRRGEGKHERSSADALRAVQGYFGLTKNQGEFETVADFIITQDLLGDVESGKYTTHPSVAEKKMRVFAPDIDEVGVIVNVGEKATVRFAETGIEEEFDYHLLTDMNGNSVVENQEIADSVNIEKPLPFGYESADEVRRDFEKLKAAVEANPDLQKVIQLRGDLIRSISSELVSLGELPETVLENPYGYYRHQVLEYYRVAESENALKGQRLGSYKGVARKEGWQKARVGSARDYNTNILEADYEVIKRQLVRLEAIKTLKELQDSPSNIHDQVFGDKKITGETEIPEGFVLWSAKPGSIWYDREGMQEEALNQFHSMMLSSLPPNVQKVVSAIDQAATGYSPAKYQMVIPVELAATLDSERFLSKSDEGPISKLSRSLMTKWKQYILLNPMRFFKYNFNNMSGDLDIVLTQPGVLKYGKESLSDLVSDLRKKGTSNDMKEARRLGVIDAGQTINEIQDINTESLLKELTGERDLNLVRRYFKVARDASSFRESWLRLAAYKHYKAEIGKGKTVYGVSKKVEIDQIKDPNHKAAKLARELLGDYGNLTEAGQYLRQRVIPFYSWMEINAPRYLRLMKNSYHEAGAKGASRSAAAVGIKGSVWMVKKSIMAGLMMMMVEMWNRLMWPEEEARLTERERKQLHIIVGSRPDGSVISVRFQGAYSDALSWMGFEDLGWKIEDVAKGETELKQLAEESLFAPINKIIGGIRPDIKVPAEALSKRSTFPDIRNTSVIRDPMEHILRTVSLDVPYRYFTGKPMRPNEEISASFYYVTNPGEAAYNDAKSLVGEWLEKQGKERPSSDPTDRANALYYYRKALQYGDKKAEEKWLKEYFNLGGTDKGMATSIRNSHPLHGITEENAEAFWNSLSEKQQDKMYKAFNWYKEVYRPDEIRTYDINEE